MRDDWKYKFSGLINWKNLSLYFDTLLWKVWKVQVFRQLRPLLSGYGYMEFNRQNIDDKLFVMIIKLVRRIISLVKFHNLVIWYT